MNLSIGYSLALVGLALSIALPNAKPETNSPIKSKSGTGYECNTRITCPSCTPQPCHPSPVEPNVWLTVDCISHYICGQVYGGGTCYNYENFDCWIISKYQQGSSCTDFISYTTGGSFSYCGI